MWRYLDLTMSNTPSISPAQIELLLKMAGKQLNIDPNALRQQLEQGDLNALGQRMGVPAEQLSQLMNNPQKLSQLISPSDLQKLLDHLR